MNIYFKAEDLAVGYNGKALISDINISLEKGKIMTLIGPNGAGKSTILKSITKQLDIIGGMVYMDQQELHQITPKDLARNMAVVLTDRIRPELMTCAEVVAMGRYPYTNMFGKLTKEDEEAVQEALERVHAMEIANQDFTTLSDGQRQRIMLARAICQNPQVLVLDEPTAYLDIRYKVELLEIIKDLAKTKNVTVIMSLHEIDLAMKASDYILCVKGDRIAAYGAPEEVIGENTIESLYNMENGAFDLLFGSVELTKPKGEPKVFVVAGGGYGIPVYRQLQRKGIAFSTGILYENDVDYQVAKMLADSVVSCEAFEDITEAQFEKACSLIETCDFVIDAGTPAKKHNQTNSRLLEFARLKSIKVITKKEMEEAL